MTLARVEVVDGKLVLIDPDACEVIEAVEKINCRGTLELQWDRVQHFTRRIKERGLDPNAVVILLLNVNTELGSIFADITVPGYNWQEIRDRGEVPYARGLALRDGIQGSLNHLKMGDDLNSAVDPSMATVIVMDYGTVAVFQVPFQAN